MKAVSAVKVAALVVTSAVLAGAAMAEPKAAKDGLTREERIARAKARRAAAERRLGGYIQAPATGLVVRVLNRQKAVSPEVVQQCVDDIKKVIGYSLEVHVDEPSDGRTAAKIELVEEAGAPTLLIAPEDKWGRLNVARLASDSPDIGTLHRRFTKELWRCYGMTLGAFNSGYSPCVMRTVFTLADLDRDSSLMPCPLVYDKIQGVNNTLKVDATRRVSYKKACQEGWAPQPTNDVQKAIWDQVHQLPTEPIKIKPETKKVSD